MHRLKRLEDLDGREAYVLPEEVALIRSEGEGDLKHTAIVLRNGQKIAVRSDPDRVAAYIGAP